MKRTFVGLPIQPHVVSALKEITQPRPEVRWIPAHNLHITVEFFGATSDAQIDILRRELRFDAIASFALTPSGLAAFPDLRRPRVIAVTTDPGESFAKVFKLVRDAAATALIRLKPPRVSPHLTLARLRNADRRWLTNYLEVHASSACNLPAIDVEQVHLYESVLSRGGAEYSVLASFPLGPQPAHPERT